jgi:hypothetical protein
MKNNSSSYIKLLCQSGLPVYEVPHTTWSLKIFIASTAYLLQFNEGNFTVQNRDDGWVILTDQHPTAIMDLNSKFPSLNWSRCGCRSCKKEFSSDHVECGTP